jgi:uncharacterized protein
VKKVLISGATGLVGTALAKHLRSAGHSVSRLVRQGAPFETGDVAWDPDTATADVVGMEGFDAVVNLNGEGIAGKRWTQSRKQRLRSSRIGPTRLLVDSMSKIESKPTVFVSASGTGYYGSRGDEVLTEESGPGEDFLSILARDWEAEARQAETQRIRTVLVRFGVIFSSQGGALVEMARPFRMGLGGKLGNGDQWMPWIAIEDAVEIVRRSIEEDKWSGPLNAVAPSLVRNGEFTRVLAKVLKRPAIFPAPAFALRMLLGEMADTLLLASQRAVPKKLLEGGFSFRCSDVEEALRNAF